MSLPSDMIEGRPEAEPMMQRLAEICPVNNRSWQRGPYREPPNTSKDMR
jgi:hypothetical protein